MSIARSKWLAPLCGWLFVIGGIHAGENPYGSIWARNSFGLKPPVVVVEVKPEPPKKDVKLVLTGFVTILNQPRAMFAIQENGGTPTYFSLAEGEKNEAVEVVKVDERRDQVSIRHNGELQTLTFEAVCPAPAPASAPPPPASK